MTHITSKLDKNKYIDGTIQLFDYLTLLHNNIIV